jgi:putative sterol carrier protein
VTDLPEIEPSQFASLIAQATDEQIAEGLATNGDLILGGVFTRWPDELDAEKARGVDAVLEWQLSRADGRVDRWQIEIHDGACSAARDGDADPDVTFRIGDVDFMKLVAGVEGGPRLFISGRLRVSGNLMLAARVQSLFRAPRPSGTAS